MATSSSSSSLPLSSQLWQGDLDLAHTVLPGLAIYQRQPLPASASTAAKGKQKASPAVVSAAAAVVVVPPSEAPAFSAALQRRTTRSRSTASGQLPTPPTSTTGPSTAALAAAAAGEGTSSVSPPVRRLTTRVAQPTAALLVPEYASSSAGSSSHPSPAQHAPPPPETTTAPTKITLTIPSRAARAASALATVLRGSGGMRLAVRPNCAAPLPLTALEAAGVALPTVLSDQTHGLELCNTGPPASWPYDGTPTGRLHELLDTGGSDGRTSSFLLVDVLSSPPWSFASSPPPATADAAADAQRPKATVAVYGWAGPLETREMRLFATVLAPETVDLLRPAAPVPAPAAAAAPTAAEPVEDAPRFEFESNYDDLLGLNDDSPDPVVDDAHDELARAIRERAYAELRPRGLSRPHDSPPRSSSSSSSSLAVGPAPDHSSPSAPPSAPSASSSSFDDPPPPPKRLSLRARLADRNRPLKDRLSASAAAAAAAAGGAGAQASNLNGKRPGVWSKPSCARQAKKQRRAGGARPAKRPTADARVGGGAGGSSGSSGPGPWESRYRERTDVHDGRVDRWRAAVAAGSLDAPLPAPPPAVQSAGSAHLAGSSVVAAAVHVIDHTEANRERLRKLTASALLASGLSRAHADWKPVFGFVVRGAAFALRETTRGRLLSDDKLRPAVDVHVAAYLPSDVVPPSVAEPTTAAAVDPVAVEACAPALVPSPQPMDVDLSSVEDAGAALPTSASVGRRSSASPKPDDACALTAKLSLLGPGETVFKALPETRVEAAASCVALAPRKPSPAPPVDAVAVVVDRVPSPPQIDSAPSASAPLAPLPELDTAPAAVVEPSHDGLAFPDDESDLTSVVYSDGDDDDGGEVEVEHDAAAEEEWVNSRPATPHGAPITRAFSSPLALASPVDALPLAQKHTADVTPARHATRSSASALLGQALFSSASQASSTAAAAAAGRANTTSPTSSAPSSSSISTPPDAPPACGLLMHLGPGGGPKEALEAPASTTPEGPTPRRSTRRVVSGSKLAGPPATACSVDPTTTTAAADAVVVVSTVDACASPPSPPLPPTPTDAPTRRSPRRAACALSKSLPPAPPPLTAASPPISLPAAGALKKQPFAAWDAEAAPADLGRAFEPSIGRGGEVVYLLSRRAREGTAVSSYTA